MTPTSSEAVRGAAVLRLVREGAPQRADDLVAVEEPLEIRLAGRPATVIMRTPGADEELARGFLFGEGLIARSSEIVAITRPANLKGEELGNVVDVLFAPALAHIRPRTIERNFYATSSCGVCGKSSLAAIAVTAPRVDADVQFSHALIATFPDRLRAAQTAFDATGGLHAAALFDEQGALLAAREDVGRHNAVDKLVGWALSRDLLPASRCALFVSGRTSFEILQKAAMAGVPLVASVSAPSSLAVALAERMGITLAGFVRAGAMNVYTHPSRITGERIDVR